MENTETKSLAVTGLHALIWQEEGLFVAKCIEVEIASQGKTEQIALKNLEEALELFFDDVDLSVATLTNVHMVSL